MPDNRQIILTSLPEGKLEPAHFESRTGRLPKPGAGEVLCRTLALTIGAGQRAALQSSGGYGGTPPIGAAMRGTGVARVEASNDPAWSPGDLVMGPTGWQEYSALAGSELTAVDAAADPALYLGVLGTNGLTAYFGLLEVGRPRSGETVLVSAAAGSVGHLVGQIAKLRDCRVVGVTGSDEKCSILKDELGFDQAINYRDSDLRAALRAATPDGIDVYFDNTGGDILGAALFRMNPRGRIPCCGVVSQYDTANPAAGPRGVPGLLVTKRLRMEGFIVYDYRSRFDQARAELRGWIDAGRLEPRTTEFSGLESAPHAFVELLAGGTVGTTVVRLVQ